MPCDSQSWHEITGDANLKQTVKEARACLQAGDVKGYNARKQKLPLIMYMCTFMPNTGAKGTLPEGPWRKQSAAVLNGLVMLDIDHVDDPIALAEKIPQHMYDERSCRTAVMLVHVTPSGHGLRVVFTADPNVGNISDNQHYFASILGEKCDEACKDASRGSFAPSEDDIIYINENIFSYENKEFDKKYGSFYRKCDVHVSSKDTVSSSSPAGKSVRVDGGKAVFSQSVSGEGSGDNILSKDYHNVPFSRIVDCWLAQHGTPQEGDRHRTLLQMAGDLRYICDNDKTLLAQVVRLAPFTAQLENEGRGDEIDKVCEDACGQKMWREIPKRLQPVLRGAGVGVPTREERAERLEADLSVYQSYWRRLKPLLAPPYDVAVTGVMDENKLGAVLAAGSMFCTLLTRCNYRHFDGRLHRMNPNCYIIGDPAAGKSFAERLDRNIMAAMRSADAPAREAEDRYKREMKARSSSSKAQKGEALTQPDGVIRYLPARTSNAVFYRRALNSKEIVGGEVWPLHLYTFDSELDSTIQAQSGGSWIGKHDLELKAFHNELSGVDFANNDSVNNIIPIFWNQVVTGTPISLHKKISLNNVNDGLCSRIAFFRMCSSNFRMIGRGTEEANHENDVKLKQWGFHFERCGGTLDLKPLVDHCYDLCEISAFEAEASSDLVLDYLRKRAVFYAEWLTVPRIVARQLMEDNYDFHADRCRVTDEDLQFATLIYDAVIFWQDKLFGQMLQDAWDNANRSMVERKRNTPSINAYNQLPEMFTAEQAMEALGKNLDNTKMQISRWKKAGYIEKQGKCYKKLVKTLSV